MFLIQRDVIRREPRHLAQQRPKTRLAHRETTIRLGLDLREALQSSVECSSIKPAAAYQHAPIVVVGIQILSRI